MNENIAAIVHPVIQYGLSLRARLPQLDSIDFEFEQARLQNLLLSEEESQVLAGYGKDTQEIVQDGSLGDTRRLKSNFLGVRYALVCWLDEIFTSHPQSRSFWTDHKLEARLYGTNDRAWKFWEQAKLAQIMQNSSAFEVFYLCVNLGFRGDRLQQADELRSWLNQAKLRLGHVEELTFPFSTEQRRQYVPKLDGESRFRTMTAVCWGALLFIVPLISFALIRRLGE